LLLVSSGRSFNEVGALFGAMSQNLLNG
jgi:hypothetical protein